MIEADPARSRLLARGLRSRQLCLPGTRYLPGALDEFVSPLGGVCTARFFSQRSACAVACACRQEEGERRSVVVRARPSGWLGLGRRFRSTVLIMLMLTETSQLTVLVFAHQL